MERLTTGSGEVDKILEGGFPTNAIHVIMGAPGTGKTILAEQICFANAAPGRPILYLSTFSEPLQKLVGFLQEFSFARAEKLGTEIVSFANATSRSSLTAPAIAVRSPGSSTSGGISHGKRARSRLTLDQRRETIAA